jgi:hypothetical protein
MEKTSGYVHPLSIHWQRKYSKRNAKKSATKDRQIYNSLLQKIPVLFLEQFATESAEQKVLKMYLVFNPICIYEMEFNPICKISF